ncbi:MAG: Mov34/MPN/PAD-1 family protein [Methanomassiliicoccus sp.]|nr:Mov34/MPN/PAD-1 family protein [Methanomassiliicoccus sp.]
MNPPLITGGQTAEVRELPPPRRDRVKAHKWLTERCLEEHLDREREGFELYISKIAEEKMRNHALQHLNERKEVMGLLLGGFYQHEGREYALVRDVATTDLDATDVSVRFDPDAFEKLFASLEEIGFKYVIVGWYHSHPSYHCFMSSTDVQTQRGMFNLRCHSAIVIDPVNKEIEAFFLDEGKVRSRPFGIYWDEYQNPYYGTSVRMRQTAVPPKAPDVPQ